MNVRMIIGIEVERTFSLKERGLPRRSIDGSNKKDIFHRIADGLTSEVLGLLSTTYRKY